MTDEMNISNEELVDEPVEAAEATEAEESAADAPEGAQPVEGAAETGEADPVVADEPQAADGASDPVEQAEVAEPAQEDDGGEAGDAYTADVADLVSDGMGDDALGLALGGLGTVSPAVVDRSGLETMLNASLAAVEASYQTLEALSYAARTWRDDTTEGPWLNATNLNSMDGQIETLTDAVNTLNTNIEAVKDDLETLGESVSHVYDKFTWQASSSWTYTNHYVTIPANSIYCIGLTTQYNNGAPKGLAFTKGSSIAPTQDVNTCVRTDSLLHCNVVGYTESEIKLYAWARNQDNGGGAYQYIWISGFTMKHV